MYVKFLVAIGLAVALSACGKSAQEELAEAQLKALQEAQAQAAADKVKKEQSIKKLTGGNGPTWTFTDEKK